MKLNKLILITLLSFVVAACGAQSDATAVPAIPTISLDTPSNPSSSSAQITASAIVVPVKKVELSFPLSGAVQSVDVVEGDSVTANQPLVKLDASVLEARLAEAEANVITQETQVAYLVRTGTDNERLEAAKANVQRAQAAVDIAKAQLAQATLLAPFDGTIASVEISPAEFASPGQIVIVMGDLTKFQIETTDLSENDVTALEIGQPASVFIEALNDNYEGKIIDIARVSQIAGGDVVYTVTIELASQPEGLRWGMSADVSIEIK